MQDSDKDILTSLSWELEHAGYKVHLTYTLDREVLELIDMAKPHVVILDYKLSGSDAIHICHLVKAFYPNLPVIAMSCNVDIRDTYVEGGFDTYLDKPFKIRTMFNLIRKFIPEKNLHQHN